MNDAPTTPGRDEAMTTWEHHQDVEQRPRDGLALAGVAFVIWAVATVFYPVDGPLIAEVACWIAFVLAPGWVPVGVKMALGIEWERRWFQPVWLVLPIVAAMLILALGAAATDAARPAVAVGLVAMLVLLLGVVGAAAQVRSRDAKLADSAVIEQRARVAADVHDIVGHTLSVTMLHLSAAQLSLPADPDAAVESLAEAERQGRRSMTEIRALIDVLKVGGDPTRTETLDVHDLPALIDGVRATGIEVTVTGEPSDVDLTAVASTTLYRFVQEGLTNAVRHGEAPINIVFGRLPDRLTVEVTNRLAAPRNRRHRRDGSGLAGARSRIEAIGGTFDASADPNQKIWRTYATIPSRSEHHSN